MIQRQNATQSLLRSSGAKPTRHQRKLAARLRMQGVTEAEAMRLYVQTMDELAARSDAALKKGQEEKQHGAGGGAADWDSVSNTDTAASASGHNSLPAMYNVRIAGLGRYLPRRIVTNAEIEQRGGFAAGAVEQTRCGVKQRHECDFQNGEGPIENAARAVRKALAAAGRSLSDVDLIINASGIPRQAVPDDASLLQRALGLGSSGVPSFTVHATCLSFVVALDVAGSRIEAGRAKCVVISSSVAARTYNINAKDMHTAPLFGDGAAACVLVPSTPANSASAGGENVECSAIHRVAFETYGDGCVSAAFAISFHLRKIFLSLLF